MLRNYFITALRYIIRNKIPSLIQVLSLAIGITAFILIGLYARHEFSYDRFHEKGDRIYRLENGDQICRQPAIGHAIKQEIPEVENVVRISFRTGSDRSIIWKYIPSNDSTAVRVITMEDLVFCDSTIFDVFTFSFIQGDPKKVFKDPLSCVLTESEARKFFGDADPMGEMISEWTVTGIIEDVKNSHMEINSLYAYNYGYNPERFNTYKSNPLLVPPTYLLLPENNNPSYIEKRLNDFFTEKWKQERIVDRKADFRLRPLKEVYFTLGLENEWNYCRHGNLKLLSILITIAVIILLLGIINYVNLSTARASLRSREIGIRKVAGSSKARLVSQFLAEAILVALMALLIALTLVQVLLPGFNQLASIELDMESVLKPGSLVILLVFIFIVGVISGIYPAIYLTRFQTVASLSGGHSGSPGPVILRRLLLTFQFAISIVLIIGVFVIFRQLNYMKSADLGFNKEQIINVSGSARWAPWTSDPAKRQVFRQHLLQNPKIRGVAFCSAVMGSVQDYRLFKSPQGTEIQITWNGLDPYFLDVMEIKLIEGRNLSWDRPGDKMWDAGDDDSTRITNRILLNETAVRELGLESPVGTFGRWPEDGQFLEGQQWEIIGVISDFHFRSQHERIAPELYFWSNYFPVASIKIAPGDVPSILRFIKKELESLFPDEAYSFEYSFLDETYNNQYLRDEKTARIIINFAVVAILIACLGLFALSSFMAARRTKEIGIRKAMGASVKIVFLLLSREFVKWVALSVIIACPVAWFAMNRWLESFAYRTNITWWIFVLAIMIAFLIAFTTVTWQSLKTARTNPVEALRYE
jgi:putative ABC transport system permease protein